MPDPPFDGAARLLRTAVEDDAAATTARAMGAMLSEALKHDGLTQAAFARMAGVSEKHLSQVITGRATAHPKTLDQWAAAIGRRFVVTLQREKPMTIRNLTPHPIRLYRHDTPDQVGDDVEPVEVWNPDGPVVRIATIDLGTQYIGVGHPVEYVEYGHVHDLPEKEARVWLVVPLVVALAAPGRNDLLVPYREVRNQSGTVVGCRHLAKPV